MHAFRLFLLGLLATVPLAGAAAAEDLDLSGATIVVRGAAAPEAERTAATVLSEEVAKRTGLQWSIAQEWPAQGAVIALLSGDNRRLQGVPVPQRLYTAKPEGYTIATDVSSGRPVVWIVGADARGALFGAGRLLRSLDWSKGVVSLSLIHI